MDRQFPIMVGWRGTAGPCPSSIPWDAIAPYEGNALENHQQSLEKLASRGGLDPGEAYLVMTGRRWKGETFTPEFEKEACAFLDKIVRDRGTLQVRLDAALLQIEAWRPIVEAAKKVCSVRCEAVIHSQQGVTRSFETYKARHQEASEQLNSAVKAFMEKQKEPCSVCGRPSGGCCTVMSQD